MRGAPAVAALAILALTSGPAPAANGTPSHVTVQSVLDPATARAAKLESLSDCVAVTPDGVAVVGNGEGLWLVGGGRTRATGVRGLTCFAFTPEGLLVGVKGRDLVHLDAGGALTPVFHLPGAGMTLVPGQGDSLLLFGREDGGGWGLYAIRPGGKVSRLLTSPEPITGAAEGGGRLLMVAGGVLFQVQGGAMRPLAGEPKGTLASVATDPAGKAVFVSDGKRIFRIEDGRPGVLADDLGGTLRWKGGGLLVFDPRRPVLVRLLGVE